MDNIKKTVIITGANSGLGLETAKYFAKDGWHIIMACRNKGKAEASWNEILNENSGCTAEVMALDLSSLSSVREFAAGIEWRGLKIDALDCNAGIGSQLNTTTEDGFDIVFESNYLGHFLLTLLLIPRMEKDARIMNISSEVHNPPEDWPEIIWPGVETLMYPNEIGRQRYALSKLCNLFFTYELNRRLRQVGSDITVNAFNPGLLLTTNLGGPRRLTAEQIKEREKEMSYWTGDIHKSANGVFTVLSDATYVDVSGKYFDRGTTIIPSSKLSYDEKIASELWDKSIEVAGLKKDYLERIL